MMTYYNTHGHAYKWKDFVDTEVKERGNYTTKEVALWKSKYNITDSDKLIWVAITPQAALAYKLDAQAQLDIKMPLDKYMKKWKATKGDLNSLAKYKSTDGVIIPESNDGCDGFLFILNNKEDVADVTDDIISQIESGKKFRYKSTQSDKIFYIKKSGSKYILSNNTNSETEDCDIKDVVQIVKTTMMFFRGKPENYGFVNESRIKNFDDYSSCN